MKVTNYYPVHAAVLAQGVTLDSPLSGDLSGTITSPIVSKINGVTIGGSPIAGDFIVATDANDAAWTSLITTEGDLIVGQPSGLPGRLAVGPDSYVLTVDPATHVPAWAGAPSGTIPSGTSAGQLLLWDGSAWTASAPSGIGTLVQNFQPAAITNGGSITLGATPTSGNILLAFIGSNQYAATAVTTTNVTWTKLTDLQYSGSAYSFTSVWRGVVAASAGTSVTVTFAGSNTNAISVHEYSGVDVDGVAAAGVTNAGPVLSSLAFWSRGGRTIAFHHTRNASPTLNPAAKWTDYTGSPANVGSVNYFRLAYHDGSTDGPSGASAFAAVTNSSGLHLIHLA